MMSWDATLKTGLGVAMLAYVAALASMSWIWPSALWLIWLTAALLWAMLSIAAWRWGNGGWQQHGWAAGRWILLIALLARLFVVATTEPKLSDDIWRYIYDGHTLLAGENPYAQAPADASPADSLRQQLATRVNHAHLVTIYQPTSQYAFAALAAVHVQAWDPLGDRTFRLGFVAVDLLVITLLLTALRQAGRSAWWAALYAWHPLTLAEIASSGHQDVLGLAVLVAAVMLWQRAKRQPWGSGAAMAAAVAVKPIVGPMAVMVAVGKDWRASARFVLAGIGVGMALYLPFVLMQDGLTGMFDTVRTFAAHWAFNGSVHGLVSLWISDKSQVDLLMGIALAGVLAVAVWRCRDGWSLGAAYLLAALLFSSTVHPWYVLWPLVLLPMRLNLAVWVLSLTVMWSYAVQFHPQDFQLDVWIRWAEWTPVFCALVVMGVMGAHRTGHFSDQFKVGRYT